MKKILFLLFACVALGSAQYNQYPINYIFQDTTLADAPFPPGSTLNLPNRSESKVWIKLTGSGNGNIQIIKY